MIIKYLYPDMSTPQILIKLLTCQLHDAHFRFYYNKFPKEC